MQYLWTGQKADNQAPRVGFIRLDNKLASSDVALKPGANYTARVNALDPEGDTLRAEWRITRDVDEFHILPQNRTAPEAIAGTISNAKGLAVSVHTPAQRGAYRLLVNVYDGHGNVTNNSFPFFVGTPDHPELGIHMPIYYNH
jgi:hypothetical protein